MASLVDYHNSNSLVLWFNPNPKQQQKQTEFISSHVAHLQNSFYNEGLSLGVQAQAYVALAFPPSDHLT